jgi:hypothetical protein
MSRAPGGQACIAIDQKLSDFSRDIGLRRVPN